MIEVNIPLTIRGIGEGRSSMSRKDEDVDGMLVQFDGDPGMVFIAWSEWKKALSFRQAMKTPTNGAPNGKGAADA
jgi:hypothetical protein